MFAKNKMNAFIISNSIFKNIKANTESKPAQKQATVTVILFFYIPLLNLQVYHKYSNYIKYNIHIKKLFFNKEKQERK